MGEGGGEGPGVRQGWRYPLGPFTLTLSRREREQKYALWDKDFELNLAPLPLA
jgi:hypothetical protein